MTAYELADRLEDDELISLKTVNEAAAKLRELQTFIDKAFCVHPNLDLDIGYE